MKFHAFHCRWIFSGEDGEMMFLLGVIAGKVGYYPEAEWLHSFRVFLILFKIEILWTTGPAAIEDEP